MMQRILLWIKLEMIYFETNYITARYMDISNFTNKYHEFKVQNKRNSDMS